MRTLDPSIPYRTLVERMHEVVWMCDEQERTVYVNPKFFEMTGYTLDDIIGKQSYDFWDPQSAEVVRRVNAGERKRGISSSYEGNIITKKGERIPVFVSGMPLENGGTMGIMTDMREVKRREEQEHLLGSAIQLSSDAIIILREDGTVLSWNRGAKTIFGFRETEIVGKTLEKMLSADDLQMVLQPSGIRQQCELHANHKQGHTVTVSATVTPVATGETKGSHSLLLIARDITTQKKVEEELAVKYTKLRDAYNTFGVLRRHMDYILELAEFAAQPHQLKLVTDFVVNAVIMLTRVDACSIRVHDPKTKTLETISSFGLSDDWLGAKTITYKESMTRKAFERGSALKIIDLTKQPNYHSRALAKKSNLHSLLVIPLIFQGELLGGLNLYARPERKLEILDNEFIERFAHVVTLVLAAYRNQGTGKKTAK